MGQSCVSAQQKVLSPYPLPKIQQSLVGQLQFRDREFIFSRYKQIGKKIQKYQLEEWITEVLSKLLSTSFYYIEENKLTYKQVRLFFCSNILKNIISWHKQQKMTLDDIRNLNIFMSKKLLPYALAKYPMSSQSEVNKKFLQKIKDIDNFDDSENDYIAKSEVIFQYRETGNYNDLIMKFLNQIIQLPDLSNYKLEIESGKQIFIPEKDTYFNIFKNYMTDMFTSCYDYNKVYQNDSAKQQMTQQKKDNYERQVKNYTTYLIGRKISNNSGAYSEDQIKNKDISIKNPAILRILTKWAEQLQNKFKNPTMFVDRVQPYNYVDKRPSFALPRKDRILLYKLFQQQKQLVNQQLKKVVQQIYKHEFAVLNESNYRSIKFISQLQFKQGFFADACMKALDSFIIKYINILIHGLKRISKTFRQKNKKLTAQCQFLTFKIGDLMRCKCHSRQKQIIYLYDKIMNCDPKILKVIRIKNRLAGGTQDILINIKFYNKFTIQIQLGIDSTKNKYVQLSTKFNHFVYQLQRAQFGPIMQICSIWQSQNIKIKKIRQAIDASQKFPKQKRQSQNFCRYNKHKLEIEVDPLLCRQCFDVFVSDKNLIQNQKCVDCQYRICSFCRIKNIGDKQLKQIIFRNQQIRNSSKRCQQVKLDKLPSSAIIFNKYSKNKRLTCFKKFEDQLGNLIFIQKMNGEDPSLLKLNQKDIENYLIWQNPLAQEYFNGITNEIVKKLCILPNMFKENQRKNKNDIQFQGHNMTELEFEELSYKLWSKQYKNNIYTLNLAANNIIQMSTILSQAPNVKFLILDENNLSKIQIPKNATSLNKLSMTKNRFNGKNQIIIDSFSDFSSLKYLNIGWNKLQQLPQQLSLLKNLQQLSAQSNKLTKIFPSINKLQKLKILSLNSNEITEICNGVWQLGQLQQLQIKANKITSLSSDIKKLKHLKKLRIDKNLIKQLPQQIGQLQFLIEISANQNQIKTLPKSIKKLKNLQLLLLNQNQLTQAQGFQDLDRLHKITLDKNKLNKCPRIQNLQRLKILQLQNNQLQYLDSSMLKSKSLQQLNLSHNLLTNINPAIKYLTSLKKLNLTHNRLQLLCDQISGLNNLQQLSLQGNEIRKLPDTFNHFLNLIKLSIETFFFQPDYKVNSLAYLKKLESKGVKVKYKNTQLSSILLIK